MKSVRWGEGAAGGVAGVTGIDTAADTAGAEPWTSDTAGAEPWPSDTAGEELWPSLEWWWWCWSGGCVRPLTFLARHVSLRQRH